MKSLGTPFHLLAASLFDDPVAQTMDQTGTLGQRDKLGRPDWRALGRLPAYQGLEILYSPTGRRDLGLVVEGEFTVIQASSSRAER